MSISSLMTKDVVSVSMDDNLATVRDIFNLVSFHHLLVVEKNEVVGIISDRDYLKSINVALGTPFETNKDLAALNKRVHQIMSRRVISISENSSLYELIELFHQKRVSCVPVVDENNAPKGIISSKDIISALALKNRKDKV
jgi:acetoin utilization protein AcuB